MDNHESIHMWGGAHGLLALIQRVTKRDASALARFRALDSDYVDVYVTTPFNVVASRRIRATLSRDGAVVAAINLQRALEDLESEHPTAQPLDLGMPRDPNWPGALPPASGYSLVDTIPVDVTRKLSDQGQALARQFSGPLGPPVSLLNQEVVQVSSEAGGVTVGVPMRVIFTCTSLGLMPGFAAPVTVPRFVRVSLSGKWLRLDAPFGTVYYNTRGFSLI